MSALNLPVSQQQPQDPNVTYVDAQAPANVGLFPIIPPTVDPAPPDTALLAISDDLRDFAADEAQNAAPGALVPIGVKSLAYDWTMDELYQSSSGAPLVVEDLDTVTEWMLMSCNTLAGVYPVFSPDYGNAALDLIGSAMPSGALSSEVARLMVESLMRFGMILAVDVVGVQVLPNVDPDALFVTLAVTTVFTEEATQITLALS